MGELEEAKLKKTKKKFIGIIAVLAVVVILLGYNVIQNAVKQEEILENSSCPPPSLTDQANSAVTIYLKELFASPLSLLAKLLIFLGSLYAVQLLMHIGADIIQLFMVVFVIIKKAWGLVKARAEDVGIPFEDDEENTLNKLKEWEGVKHGKKQ